MSLISFARRGRILAFLAGALLFVPMIAEAAPGGRSFGSRSMRTQTQVPSTRTAPQTAPMQRQTQPNAAQPAAGAAAQAARPSFARNMMMGLGAGLLGAGLFGMLSGAGFFSGLASFAGFLGFLLQIALIAGAIFLAIRFFRRRSQPQVAMAGGLGRDSYQPQPAAPMAGLGGGAAAAAASAKPVEFELSGDDFSRFERILTEVQEAASEEKLDALRTLAVPEVVEGFAEEFAENTRKGLIERSAEVKLLQGDLAETWREGDTEFATVAMRFSLLNALVERGGSGRVVEGHATIPREATEHWTFSRQRGGAWQVCGIQPVG